MTRAATIAAGEQHVYEIVVPKGATSLRAAIKGGTDPRADLDLYLLDCTEPERPPDPEPRKEQERGNKAPTAPDPVCATRAKSDDVDADGEVEVAYPRAGRWVAVVDAFVVPSGRTEYDYLDLFTHAPLGTLAVADLPAERSSGALWTVKANAWVAELPAPPRQLHARVMVTSGDVTQPVRTVEGFDASGLRTWHVPLGSADVHVGGGSTSAPPGRALPPNRSDLQQQRFDR